MQYADIAHRRSLVKWMARQISDNLVASELQPKDKVVTPEVFYGESEVPQRIIQDMLNELIDADAKLQAKMSQFKWLHAPTQDPIISVDGEPEKPESTEKPDAQADQSKKKPGRRKKPEPSGT